MSFNLTILSKYSSFLEPNSTFLAHHERLLIKTSSIACALSIVLMLYFDSRLAEF